ncbi:MAG: hypothetical protein ACPG5B_06900 [Chitinophagales bacterium]
MKKYKNKTVQKIAINAVIAAEQNKNLDNVIVALHDLLSCASLSVNGKGIHAKDLKKIAKMKNQLESFYIDDATLENMKALKKAMVYE